MKIINRLEKGKASNKYLYRSHAFSKITPAKLIGMFWSENPVFFQLLQEADLETIRKRVFNYLADFERKNLTYHHSCNTTDRNISRQCIQTLKNIFSIRSEELTGHSVLKVLMNLAQQRDVTISTAFIEDLRQMFLGMKGKTELGSRVISMDHFDHDNCTEVARNRSKTLNMVGEKIEAQIYKYTDGLDEEVIRMRADNRDRIIKVLGASLEQWNDWKWQCRNIVRNVDVLEKMIKLTPKERMGIERAVLNKLPFGITPYYVSLMDYEPGRLHDHAVRAQVIPSLEYVENVLLSKKNGTDLDFMGEKDTSPIDLVTRRYPQIAIFKPYNTCAQICVYCQRNWEITDVLDECAKASKSKLESALKWFEENPAVTEVLVTGGDPAVMNDSMTRKVLSRLAEMDHIRRIRIGTRTPVVLPMRITDKYANMLASFIEPGVREVAVMTHFEHLYEITTDSVEAVSKLRSRGVPVYNQGVFTTENARRFEMVGLRQALRTIGVEPYYTFNAKGKEETRAYRVPIARLIQEQVEEARLTPGLTRCDEAVFNIPRIGKSYLRAGQSHEVIMLLPDGSRVYEFYPWDLGFADTRPYLHEDVPILDFLAEMYKRGENPDDYRSIWYYF
ncbi:KamA family radical SAM protein [Phosphitispora sp. TUW77]|uniref:KamA family radical SAM protein n=1 Tax=Phosphitispora sp. TUW77 TaxID=3152361 RepID=UPI003AB71DF3